MSRLSHASKIDVVKIERPFSNFKFAEGRFGGGYPIRRLFSQARCRDCKTLVIEDVPAAAAVADENAEILELFPDYQMTGLVRLSFWKVAFTKPEDMAAIDGLKYCVGYALLKRDSCQSRKIDGWHIFESAVVKYDHDHNYNPTSKMVSFRAGPKEFEVPAVLYCQQNGLNKVCAQVGLRSICATYLGNFDLTYRQINDLAFVAPELREPWQGLKALQIPRVLKGLDIPYFEFDYGSNDAALREALPYQRVLYSGIEAGTGGLVAFKMSGPKAGTVGHIIPFFGHTFNEDTWVPNADGEYFKVGEQIRYIPSDSWLSSFIVHDDNFGSNLCIPKSYLKRENAQYVVALLPRGFVYNGLWAEIAASNYFYSLVNEIAGLPNPWLSRLLSYALESKLILRLVPVTQEGYLRHLSELEDWEFEREDSETLRQLKAIKPQHMWMVEVSVPDLFSTNKRKIGELLLDATRPFSEKTDFTLFVLARFPGCYLFFDKLDEQGQPQFIKVKSSIQSHTDVLRR
ncbi:MAG: hypothetical protein WC661_02115 [Opitutaceae bacterium]|jgi:hypothetical protein